MKKKIFGIFLIFMLIIPICFSISACNEEDYGELQMDVKYILTDHAAYVEKAQGYYLFKSNGTGEYKYYSNYISDSYTIVSYKIHFKYTYIGSDKEAVACYYDSLEICDDNNKTISEKSDWNVILTVSKNVLMNTKGDTYTNKNFLDTLPNYAK